MCFIFIGYSVVHENFDDVKAVKLTAIMANVAVFSPLIGPIVGSAITAVSRWQYIFIVSGVLGLIAFIGLFRFMPKGKIVESKINIPVILRSYKAIFTHKNFMLGILTNSIAIFPIIAWIGLSPTIILNKMHQTFSVYIVYQSIIFLGFIISSTMMQKIAGRFSFKKIIKSGSSIAIIAIIVAALFHNNGIIFIIAMFVYTFGFGICNGVLIRISLMSTGQSGSLTTAAFSLLNASYVAIGLEVYNIVCGLFDYSLTSYALLNIPFGILFYLGAKKFAKMNRDLAWQ